MSLSDQQLCTSWCTVMGLVENVYINGAGVTAGQGPVFSENFLPFSITYLQTAAKIATFKDLLKSIRA